MKSTFGLATMAARMRTVLALVIGWPVGVVVHEIGHAAVAAATGAKVSGIHFQWIRGSVEIESYTSVTERWSVFLAGSLAVATCSTVALAWALTSPRIASGVRQLVIEAVLVMLVGQLIVHPLLVLGWFSDWTVIYDFRRTPGLSWAAAVGHAFLVGELAYWYSTRIRWTLRSLRSGQEASS